MNAQQPPPVPNPYGPEPDGTNPYGPQNSPQGPQYGPPESGPPQYGPQYGPPGGSAPPPGFGPPPGWQPPERKRQKDSQPGRFTWWDLGATLFYVGGFLTGLVGLLAFLPPIGDLLASEDENLQQQGLFLINAASYGLLAAVALVLSGAALWRSIKALSYLWWLKLLLVPVAWIAMLILNAVFILGLGEEPETSENQEAIEAMLGAVPFLAAVVVIALLGPYVEEYFFRHLLVGKLSRYINVWICGVISVVTFPLLHFIPALIGLADDLSLLAVVPYFTMGALITVGYIVTGRNLFYAWLLHAFNNFMSLVGVYFVLPWAEGYLEDYGVEATMATLGGLVRAMARITMGA